MISFLLKNDLKIENFERSISNYFFTDFKSVVLLGRKIINKNIFIGIKNKVIESDPIYGVCIP